MRILLLAALLTGVAHAQNYKKAFEELRVYNFADAKAEFEKNLHKKENPVAAYGLCKFFAVEKSPFFNMDSSFYYLQLAVEWYKPLDGKERGRARDDFQVDETNMRRLLRDHHKREFETLRRSPGDAAFLRYLSKYPDSEQRDTVIALRYEYHFKEAALKNTPEAYKAFIDSFPEAKHVAQARQRFDQTTFDRYADKNTPEAFAEYIRRHPDGPYLRRAQDTLYALSTRLRVEDEYADFIKKHPDNPHVPQAWDSLYQRYTREADLEALLAFRNRYRNYPDTAKLYRAIDLYTATLYPIVKNGLWGYRDTSGRFLLDYKYADAEMFVEHRAVVEQNHKYAYLLRNGELLTPFQFDEAEPMHDGMALVKQKGKYGLIDRKGGLRTPCVYDEIGEFAEGFAPMAQEGQWGYLGRDGNVFLEPKFAYADTFCRGRALVRQRLTESQWPRDSAGKRLSDDLVPEEGFVGYIDGTGKAVIPFQYEWGERFIDGTARVRQFGLYGLIDRDGRTVLPCRYEQLGPLQDGRAQVVRKGKLGFVNAAGEEVIPPEYDVTARSAEESAFVDGLAKVWRKGKIGLIDTAGKVVLPPEYDDVLEWAEGRAAFKLKGKWGYLGPNRKPVIKPQFDRAWSFHEGWARAQAGGKVGFIDTAGRFVLKPLYDEALDFEDTLARVRVGQLFGLINRQGQYVIPPEMDLILPLSEGVIKLIKNDRLGYYLLRRNRYMWREQGF